MSVEMFIYLSAAVLGAVALYLGIFKINKR